MSSSVGRLAVLASLLAPAAGYNAVPGFAGAAPVAFSSAAARRTAPRAIRCEVSSEAKVITCGNCKATYVVEDLEAFGEGQQVKCSNCEHEWFQSASRLNVKPPDMDLIEYPEDMKERLARGLPAEPVARYRCFVGNLPFGVTEEEIRELFERVGTVASATVMVDENGRPKGFGFVNMESMVSGAKAVEELDGYELQGRAITVSEGKQSTGRGRGDGRGRGRGRGDGRGRGRGRGDGRGRGRGSFD